MADLNTLVQSVNVRLLSAFDINNEGFIVGQAYDVNNGNVVPFVATPK